MQACSDVTGEKFSSAPSKPTLTERLVNCEKNNFKDLVFFFYPVPSFTIRLPYLSFLCFLSCLVLSCLCCVVLSWHVSHVLTYFPFFLLFLFLVFSSFSKHLTSPLPYSHHLPPSAGYSIRRQHKTTNSAFTSRDLRQEAPVIDATCDAASGGPEQRSSSRHPLSHRRFPRRVCRR